MLKKIETTGCAILISWTLSLATNRQLICLTIYVKMVLVKCEKYMQGTTTVH